MQTDSNSVLWVQSSPVLAIYYRHNGGGHNGGGRPNAISSCTCIVYLPRSTRLVLTPTWPSSPIARVKSFPVARLTRRSFPTR